MNKEVIDIVYFTDGFTSNSPDIHLISVEESTGRSGNHTFKIRYEHSGIKREVFAKAYNITEKLFDDEQMIRAEVYALRRAYSIGIPSPKLIGADIKGKRVKRPTIVTSIVDGLPLDDYFEGANDTQREKIANQAFNSLIDPIDRLGRIRSPNSSFGPLFKPSWIRDVNNFQEFLTMGLYREFWRRGMLDETYTFHSEWAKTTFDWASNLINGFQLRNFQLCHGDLDGMNLLFDFGKKGELKLTGIVDWEYAYWGPPEKDWGDFLASTAIYINYAQIKENMLSVLVKKGLDVNTIIVSMVHRLMILSNSKKLNSKDRESLQNLTDIIVATS